MWSYVKGLLLGLFLLWLVLMLSFAISDGFIMAIIYGVLMARTALTLLQKVTGGTGLYILVFLIFSLWVWSFRRRHRTAAAPASPAPEVQPAPAGSGTEKTEEN